MKTLVEQLEELICDDGISVNLDKDPNEDGASASDLGAIPTGGSKKPEESYAGYVLRVKYVNDKEALAKSLRKELKDLYVMSGDTNSDLDIYTDDKAEDEKLINFLKELKSTGEFEFTLRSNKDNKLVKLSEDETDPEKGSTDITSTGDDNTLVDKLEALMDPYAATDVNGTKEPLPFGQSDADHPKKADPSNDPALNQTKDANLPVAERRVMVTAVRDGKKVRVAKYVGTPKNKMSAAQKAKIGKAMKRLMKSSTGKKALMKRAKSMKLANRG